MHEPIIEISSPEDKVIVIWATIAAEYVNHFIHLHLDNGILVNVPYRDAFD